MVVTMTHRSVRTPDPPSLTDRYLDVVAHRTPRGRRDTVTGQVRTRIESGVSGRMARGLRSIDAERETLAELGDPARVAADAVGPRWLVGPSLYPQFVRVLRLVASIAVPLISALVAATGALAGDSLLQVLSSTIEAAFGAVVNVAFWVTLVFVVVDRAGVDLDRREQAWSPDDLPVQTRTAVGLTETVIAICVKALLIGLVLWPWRYWPSAGGDAVPVVNDQLRPWTTAAVAGVLAAGIVLVSLTYRLGRWSVGLATANTLLNSLLAAVVIGLAVAGRLLNPGFADALGDSPLLSVDQAHQLYTAIAAAIGSGVGIGCALDAISSWRKALRTTA